MKMVFQERTKEYFKKSVANKDKEFVFDIPFDNFLLTNFLICRFGMVALVLFKFFNSE